MQKRSPSTDALTATKVWFERAVPEPTSKNVHTQLGVHFEEVAEMVNELHGKDVLTHNLLVKAQTALEILATHLKASDNVLEIKDRKLLLDSITDQFVTGVGSAHMMEMKPVGALEEVNESNYSKFVNGHPVFDENMKIQKGPDYFKPDLSKFV